MTYYAYFDHTKPEPQQVVGWYDTDLHDYTLPDAADLLEVTEAQWAGRMTNPSGWAVEAGALVSYTPPPPTPTADGEYTARIADGIAITSTGTPALNATYPLDTTSVAWVGSIARDAASGLGLPNGAATVPIKDIDGTPHDFSETNLIALYKAERDLLSALAAQRDVMAGGGTPVWPDQTATIP